jgi:hypothetical protein
MKGSTMKPQKQFFIAVLLFITSLNSYTQITFEKTYGGSSSDYGYSVQQTNDGGYVIVGGTSSFGAGSSDVYLIKTNANGETLWAKTFGGSGDDEGYSVRQTSDSGYVITGGTTSFGNGSFYVYLIKTNADGDTLWTKTFGGSSDDVGYSVKQTSDSGYVVAGYTNSFGAGQGDFYLIKTNSAGDALWTKTFGGSSDDVGYTVQQTSDSGYVIAGYTSSFGAGGSDVYLIKTDTNGDTLWTKIYGGSNNDDGHSVQQTSDGGYVIAGTTSSFGAGSVDIYLIKTNAAGDTLWTKTNGGSSDDFGKFVQQTSDSGYVITGGTTSFGTNGSVYLIKTNTAGDTLWTKTYDESWPSSVQQASDGGYVIAGYTDSFGAGSYDVYLIKTNANGFVTDVTVKVSAPNSLTLLQNYPNPFNPSTTISFQIPNSSFVNLKVYDILGNEVATLINEVKPAGTYEVKFDAADLSSGIYFYTINAGTFVETKKMILMK